MKSILVLLISTLSFTAEAAVSNFRITSGTSNNFDVTITQDAWGVMAGPNFDPDGIIDVDPTEPYNSCELPTAAAGGPYPILPCHEDRVDGPTIITVIFTESETFTNRNATAIFTTVDSDVVNPQPQEIARSSTLFSTGQQVTLEFTWADVCQRAFSNDDVNAVINGDGQCEGFDGAGDSTGLISGNVPVSIGLNDGTTFGQISNQQINFRLYSPGAEVGIIPLGDDTNEPCGFSQGNTTYSGVCEVFPVAGDDGAFLLESLDDDDRQTRFLGGAQQYEDSFTSNTASLAYTGIRLYFFDSDDLSTYFPFSTSARIVDLDVNTPFPLDLDEDSISGLENGVLYRVLASSIDESGTVSQFFLPRNDTINGTAVQGYCENGFCPTVTPSQIAGVIAESDCFITTATYGSSSAYQVKTFQNFREHFLRGNTAGDLVISFYEDQGPKAAVFINNNKHLKPVVRVLLFPLYLTSKLYLKAGGLVGSVVLFGLFLLSLSLFKRREAQV